MCLHTPHAALNSLSAKTLTRPHNLKMFPPHLRKEKLIMAVLSTARLMIPLCSTMFSVKRIVCAFIM